MAEGSSGPGSVMDQQLLRVGEALECTLDSELEKLEQPDELQRLRQQRLQELKAAAEKQSEWKQHGHGEYSELATEKDFFGAAKASESVVCHFHRSNRPCKILDGHLTILARAHMETKFLKLDAEKSPFLTEKLHIRMLPTLALLKHGKVVDYVVGFDELGGQEDFPTEVLEARLARAGVLQPSEDLGSARRREGSVRQGGGF